MQLEKIFKRLILSQVILFLCYIPIIAFFPTPDIPQDLQLKYVKPVEEISWLYFIIVFIIFFTIHPWGLYKLYKFQNIGRIIYIIFFILNFPFIILSGNSMETPWTNILGLIENCMTGFLIALMYFSPLKEKFTEKRNIL